MTSFNVVEAFQGSIKKIQVVPSKPAISYVIKRIWCS